MSLTEQTTMWTEKEALYREMSANMQPMAGLDCLLRWCDSNSISTIIVTNAPRVDAQHTMGVLGLSERFAETVVIGNECSASKPKPDPYLEGLRRLDLPAAQCVAFEDSLNGCRSAVAAGLFTFGVSVCKRLITMYTFKQCCMSLLMKAGTYQMSFANSVTHVETIPSLVLDLTARSSE